MKASHKDYNVGMSSSSRSIYRNLEGEKQVLELYQRALGGLKIKFEERMISTRHGNTHTLITGSTESPPLIIFQGGNTINPVTLSWFLPLLKEYRVFAPDTIGHPGKSEQNRISPSDDSFGEWAVDLLDNLGLEKSSFIGPSYGAGIILRLAAYAPERISSAVLLMPSGIASGPLLPMLIQVVLPMFLYRFFPNHRRLTNAVRPLFTKEMDEIDVDVIGAVYEHVNLETKMPRHASQKELMNFIAPTLIFAGEEDIFFPAKIILPRAKEIINNLISVESIKGCRHFPSKEILYNINNRIRIFLSENR